MKPAYSYYTDKMWRFFIPRAMRHQEEGTMPEFRDDVDHLNYVLCSQVWSGLSPMEKDVLTIIYCTPHEELEDTIHRFANKHALSIQAVWSISHRLGRRLGIRKGLIAEEHKSVFMKERNGG